jgi:hypothetical protein
VAIARTRTILLAMMIIATLAGCTQPHHREVNKRLAERFGVAGAPEAELDSAVRAAVIQRVPLGSPVDSIYRYLESRGFFSNATYVSAAPHEHYAPSEHSLKIKATLEDYRPHWYSPFDICDYPVELISDLSFDRRLSSVTVVRHGYCI